MITVRIPNTIPIIAPLSKFFLACGLLVAFEVFAGDVEALVALLERTWLLEESVVDNVEEEDLMICDEVDDSVIIDVTRVVIDALSIGFDVEIGIDAGV
jgi:hypothetical protein